MRAQGQPYGTWYTRDVLAGEIDEDPTDAVGELAGMREEQFAADLESFAEMLLDDSGVDVETVRHALLQQARQLLDCRGDCDPAARAKRELGEWLTRKPERSWTRAELKVGGFSVILTETDDEGDAFPVASGSGSSEHEAITAALRAAKESAR